MLNVTLKLSNIARKNSIDSEEEYVEKYCNMSIKIQTITYEVHNLLISPRFMSYIGSREPSTLVLSQENATITNRTYQNENLFIYRIFFRSRIGDEKKL